MLTEQTAHYNNNKTAVYDVHSAVAISTEDNIKVTYAELDNKANCLAIVMKEGRK